MMGRWQHRLLKLLYSNLQMQPDINPALSHEQYLENCKHYADWAFFCAPERFLFRHYDEQTVLSCVRPMVGIEVYDVTGLNGGWYGSYPTRTVNEYLQNGTWIEVDSKKHFLSLDINKLKSELAEKEAEMASQLGIPE